MLTKAEVSGVSVMSEEEEEGKSLKGSHTSKEKGSKMLLLPLPKKLRIIAIFSFLLKNLMIDEELN